jgi:hypothetical protein
MPIRRKLAELWEIDGDYHIRIEVGAFQRELGANSRDKAEEIASFEVIEVLRKIVAESDAANIRIERDLPR